MHNFEDTDDLPNFGNLIDNDSNKFDSRKNNSKEIEDYILGNIISFPSFLKDKIDMLEENDFYFDFNIHLFKASKYNIKNNNDIELTSLSEFFSQERKISFGESYSQLNHIYNFYYEKGRDKDGDSIRSNFDANFKILKTYSAQRKVDKIARDWLKNENSKKPEDMSLSLGKISNIISDIGHNISVEKDKTSTMDDIINDVFNKVEETMSRCEGDSDETIGISTGFSGLDQAIAGFQDGNLYILGGRPSMGKTAVSLELMLNTALSGHPVLFFSAEMGADKVVKRLICNLANVTFDNLSKGRLSDKEWVRVKESSDRLRRLNFEINDESNISINKIKQISEKWYNNTLINSTKKGTIWLDYLQLLEFDKNKKFGNKTEAVGDISRQLKNIARKYAPTIALSQLNRTLEQRTNKRPINADLRESGEIEQDADLIMFIYRDIVYNKETANKNEAELIISKQRDGPTGTFYMDFDGPFQKFKGKEFRTL